MPDKNKIELDEQTLYVIRGISRNLKRIADALDPVGADYNQEPSGKVRLTEPYRD